MTDDELTLLRAGSLTLALDGPDLRYVAYQGEELVRRVYVAVRDLDWGTIPGAVCRREVDVRHDSFSVRMELEHRGGDIAFDWTLEAEGDARGAVEYIMRARARGTFAFAKVGLNIHHPIAGLAGRRWTAVGPGTPLEGVMPERIHPQVELRREGWHLPLFPPVRELALDHEAGTMRFSFGGDLYEIEDQRNWSDASYKTCSMPANTGYEHHVVDGQEIVQRLRMTFEPREPRQRSAVRRVAGPPSGADARLEIGPLAGRVLPPIGLAYAGALHDAAAVRIAALAPAHLRLDLDLGATGWERAFADGLATCVRVGAAAELALFLAGDPRPALSYIDRAVRDSEARVARVLAFRPDEQVTPTAWVMLVRKALTLDAPIGGGTNLYFNELNRSLPDLRPFAVIAWSLNPQVHAFGDRDLVENLDGQGEQLRSGRAFAGDRQLVVTPVSLRPRFNAVARPGMPSADNADPRQETLFGAAWTLGSLKQCAEGGADAVTYYETSGRCGVLDGGGTYPLYHVLADATALTGGLVHACRSGEEPWLSGLAVRTAGTLVVLVANLCDQTRTVELHAGRGSAARVRVLDEATAPLAREDPTTFRARADVVPLIDGAVALSLSPYGTARVELV